MTTYALTRPLLLNLQAFANHSGVHPSLVERFVDLGLLEPIVDASGGLWFRPEQRAQLARVQRLRASFSINYAAVGLVVDLLDRIAELEAQNMRHRSAGG